MMIIIIIHVYKIERDRDQEVKKKKKQKRNAFKSHTLLWFRWNGFQTTLKVERIRDVEKMRKYAGWPTNAQTNTHTRTQTQTQEK